MGRPYTCEHCGGTSTIWKGCRPTKAGRVRLRQCKTCKRKFTTKQLLAPAVTATLPIAAAVITEPISDAILAEHGPGGGGA